MREPLRTGVLQAAGATGNVAGNLHTLRRIADKAAQDGVHLLVCPELFLTGYHLGARVRDLAEPADGPSAREVADIARTHGLAIVYGYPERAGPDVYNAARVIDETGRPVVNYRKAHLYGEYEQRSFRPGERLVLATVRDVRVGVLICYDLEFPEAARALALAGAELLAVPTALMEPDRFIPTTLVPTRAWENQVHVAYANRCDSEHGTRYTGLSGIWAPDGRPLAQAGQTPALIVADVSPEAYGDSRKRNPYLTERRPEVYEAPPEPGE